MNTQANIVDKVVGWFSPRAGYKRMAARASMSLLGSAPYSAATSKPSLKGWDTSSGDADADSLDALPTLRERSRDLIRNAPVATGVINTVQTSVVGSGLTLDATIDKKTLEFTDEQAKEWESKTEREFKLWAENTCCDAERTLNFYGLQNLAFRQTLENGDVFGLLTYIERDTPYDLAINMIEADRCSNPDFRYNTSKISGGVEKDEHGAPKKYYFQHSHPGSLFNMNLSWKPVDAFNSMGLRNVLHLYDKKRPGQSRGVPYLAPVIEALKQLERFSDAELMAAVISGMYTAFLEDDDLEDIPPAIPDDDSVETTDSPQEFSLSAGTIISAGKGKKLKATGLDRPNQSFEPFFLAIVKQIGAALGVPFEILMKNFQASFSASQAAMYEAWRFFKARRNWLATYFCQPVYERFLFEAVAKGRIDAPGFFTDPLKRKAYLSANWIGPAKGMIDELKEIKAAKERINVGISTLKEETANLTGGDWEKKTEQRGVEVSKRRQNNLEKEAE